LIGQPQAAISETEMRRHVQGAVAIFLARYGLGEAPRLRKSSAG
jgi:hypothetical protein